MKYTPESCYQSLVETFTPKDSSSETRKNAWCYVLRNVKCDVLKEALSYFLTNWTTEPYKPRIPTQADFFAKCKEIIKLNDKSNEYEEIEEIEPLTKTEAAALYKKLSSSVKVSSTEKHEQTNSKIVVYEIWSISGYRPYYLCFEHVDKKEFISACNSQFLEKPRKVDYAYRRFTTVTSKDKKGNVINKSSAYLPCNKGQKGAKPVTIGT